MTTEPTDYPESWRPRGAPPFDTVDKPESELKPLEMELTVAAMSDQEFESFIRRARGGRS